MNPGSTVAPSRSTVLVSDDFGSAVSAMWPERMATWLARWRPSIVTTFAEVSVRSAASSDSRGPPAGPDRPRGRSAGRWCPIEMPPELHRPLDLATRRTRPRSRAGRRWPPRRRAWNGRVSRQVARGHYRTERLSKLGTFYRDYAQHNARMLGDLLRI
jgi:hypothetical protein